MLISELRRALQETADQATFNTRTSSELEVHLHKDEEEAREQEQRRRAAVTA